MPDTGVTVNRHVEMLNGYQPLDADFARIFFEGSDHTLALETRAFATLRSLVTEPSIRLVVLTGDAGHGKTHLCARLLAELRGVTVADVAEEINHDGYGLVDLHRLKDGRALRFIKDLSECDTATGATLLADAAEADRVTVVCANEGRLRSCIKSAGLDVVLNALQDSILLGRSRSGDSQHAIINLNHQSVAGSEHDGESIVDQLMGAWVVEAQPWGPCEGCAAKTRCPIYSNRSELTSPGSLGQSRRSAVRLLLSIAERTGHTVTIRELLIAVAHMLTGGLHCEEVHERASADQEDRWQHRYLYHQAVFGELLAGTSLSSMQVFKGLMRLDPASVAIRDVDDRLDPSSRQDVGTLPPPIKIGVGAAPSTAKGRDVEAENHRALWRFMRRRGFFHADALAVLAGGPPSAMQRLGFSDLQSFDELVEGRNPGSSTKVRDTLLRGLEAIQGIRRSGIAPLAIVDPAFTTQLSGATSLGAGRLSSTSTIVATEVAIPKVRLRSEYDVWIARSNDGKAPTAKSDVDWIDRRVIVSFDGDACDPKLAIPLLLHEFEFILRAARGLQSKRHFDATIRSVLRRLGDIAGQSVGTGHVYIYRGGRREELLIDGERIVRMGN